MRKKDDKRKIYLELTKNKLDEVVALQNGEQKISTQIQTLFNVHLYIPIV